MNNRQMRVRNSYQAALFALERKDYPGTPECLAALQRLRDNVAEIEVCRYEQHDARRSRTLTRLRYELDGVRTEQMLPLSRFGLRLFAGDPSVTTALRVPHKRAPTDELLSAAERLVKTLNAHRLQLRAAKIDPARIDRLRKDTRRLKMEFRAAYAGLADRAVPTRRLAELMKTARLELRVLDALVGAHANKGVLHDWKNAIRVHKRIGRPRVRKVAAIA